MGYSPVYKGQTGPPWTPAVTLDNGNPANIVGATNFILYIKDPTGSIAERTGGGTVTITNGTLGQITYPWVASDTATVGKFMLQFQWTTAAGLIQFADPVTFEVKTT